jgi:tetratricopeptide (TPR) repeat protein
MLDEAVEAYKTTIALKPDFAEAYSNMGVALRNQGKLDEAIEAYRKAISLRPNDADTYFNLGIVLKDQGKFAEAVEAYKKSISLKPDNAKVYNNLGVVLQAQDKCDEAIQAYDKAILLKSDYAEAFNNKGALLQELGEFDMATEVLNKSISLKLDYPDAYNNMGLNLQSKNKFEEAINAFYKSISFKPDYADAHQNLSLALLNIGRLKEGLDQYEWRWKTDKFLGQKRKFLQPLWDGKQSLNGKRILLWCEQGVGDTLNWSSCLPFVTSLSKHVIMECQEKLVPLLKRSFPNVEVKPEDRSLDMNRDDFDYHLPMGSLYKHFLQEITANPKPDAYLIPDPDRVNYWRDRLNSLGKGPYIGISWKSSNMSVERLPNYSSISEWSEILSIPNVTFINLQSKDFEEDLSKVREELGVTVHNFDDLDHWNNIDDVAALCTAIDIVICNHGTVPLISGGVGTATKLANWRQSSWNNILHNPVGPSIDIYERDTLEPWDNVFKLIAQESSEQKVITT